MAKIIEAKAIISAEDKTGAAFDSIAKKLANIGKAAKVSTEIDKMSKSMQGAAKQLAAIEKFNMARGGFAAANANFREMQSRVEGAARALAAASAPTRALEQAYRSAQNAVRGASRAYEEQKAAVLSAKRAIEAGGGSILTAAAEQRKLKSAIEAANVSLAKQNSITKQTHQRIARGRVGENVGGIVGGLIVGNQVKEVGKKAVVSAAEFDIGVRKQRAFTDVPEDVQNSLLIPQAKKIGQDTQFSNLDVVKAQTTAMQGLPASFGPQLRAEVGAGLVENVKNYALVMESDMSRAAEAIRGFLQNMGKDIGSKEKALAEAQRATNLIVKMAKLGGMNDEDVQSYLKFGAPTAKAAGLSDTTFGAIGSVGRRGGLRGDELGVFTRAISSKLVAPTSKGLDALAAAGIDYNSYTKMPGGLNAKNLEAVSKRRFGKGFSADQSSRITDLLDDGELVSNREEFIKQVSAIVEESFDKKKGGKTKAQDSQKIAKMVGDYYKLSVGSVDSEGLLQAVMTNPRMTIALLNALFTDKHGGKGSILAANWPQFKDDKAALDNVGNDPDFAQGKANEIMGGLGGSFERLKGSVDNIILSLGTANTGRLTAAFDSIGNVLDAVSNADEKLVRFGTDIAAASAALIAFAAAAKAGQVINALTGNPMPLKPGGKGLMPFGLGSRGLGWTAAALAAYEYGPDVAAWFVPNALGKQDHPITGDPWQSSYNAQHPLGTVDRLRADRDRRRALHGWDPQPLPLQAWPGGDMGDAPALPRSYGQGGGQPMQVELVGQGQVNVNVKVTGPAQVTDTFAGSSGNIKVNAGATTVGGPAPGPSAN